LKRIPKIKSIFEIIFEAFSDKILIILLIAATVSMALGSYEDPAYGWIDGLSIYIAVVAIVSITSTNNWIKEK
jgi:magnesium-transporting ATPase (P-type)